MALPYKYLVQKDFCWLAAGGVKLGVSRCSVGVEWPYGKRLRHRVMAILDV